MPIRTRAEVYHNTKVKNYPDGTQRITVCSRAIFKDEGWELVDSAEPKEPESKPKTMTNEVRSDNMKRAKEKVFDIALCNPFTHFVTWTLDKEKIDRYSPEMVSRKLKKFLDNMKQRHELLYLIIPELHKDGAIHMHGLIAGNVSFVDSGRRTKDGKTIYNMPQWKMGFSTAIELGGEPLHVAKYITKYISKDFRKIFGSFYYAGGDGLVRKAQLEFYDTDYNAMEEKEYGIEVANLGFKYRTVNGNVNNEATAAVGNTMSDAESGQANG